MLRKNHNIPNSTILTFVQLEINNNEQNSLINPVEYEVYDDNKNRVNLSVCNDTEIEVVHSIKDNFEDYSLISSFLDSNIDIFNINDSFYHDICKAYYNSKHDLILKDRIKDIYEKYGVCEEGCSYNEFNKEHKTVSCSCKTKTQMSNRELTLNVKSYNGMNITSSPVNTDFSIIKCYKLVFSFVDKSKNVGFWIFLILVSTYIPFIFIYLFKGIKSVREYIIREMTKNRYISIHHISKQEILEHLKRKMKTLRFLSQKKLNLHSPGKKKRKKKNKSKTFKSSKIKLSEGEIINQRSGDKEIQNINYNNNIIIFQKNRNIKRKNKKNKSEKSPRINNMHKDSLNSDALFKRSPMHKRSTKIIDNKGLEIKKYNDAINNDKKFNEFNFLLIYRHIHHPDRYSPVSSKHILNNYNYEESIKYDQRSVCDIFYIFLLYKQEIIYTIYYKSPLEIFSFRFLYLLLTISLDFALNAIFYSQYSISKKYRSDKNLIIFTFIYNLGKIFFSTFIGFIFMIIFNNLGTSINNTIDVFRKEEEKMKNIKGYTVEPERRKEIVKQIEKIILIHTIKIIILFIIELLFMLFFWYYVTDFCHIYPKTQLSWLFDSFLTLLLRFIIILLFSLLFSYLYRISVSSKNNCLYKFTRFVYNF